MRSKEQPSHSSRLQKISTFTDVALGVTACAGLVSGLILEHDGSNLESYIMNNVSDYQTPRGRERLMSRIDSAQWAITYTSGCFDGAQILPPHLPEEDRAVLIASDLVDEIPLYTPPRRSLETFITSIKEKEKKRENGTIVFEEGCKEDTMKKNIEIYDTDIQLLETAKTQVDKLASDPVTGYVRKYLEDASNMKEKGFNLYFSGVGVLTLLAAKRLGQDVWKSLREK